MSKVHKLLTRLEESGDLKDLVISGFCAPVVIRDLNIFRYVDARTVTGDGQSRAVRDAAKAFRCCESSVWKTLKKFK